MKRYIPLLLIALVFSGCATNPASKESDFVLMSEKQELELGQQMAREVTKQLPLLPSNDPLVKYVNKVGQRVATTSDRPELFYRFHVVDDGTINAFALPGGYIYVHRGLLVHFNSEAELAAVLGHEIGHVTARHAVQRYTQAQAYNLGMAVASVFVPIPDAAGQLSNILATAMIMGYGREQELESDELSLRYLTSAGYDANATIELLKTLERLDAVAKKEQQDTTGEKPKEVYHGAFSSHPETKTRIEEAIAQASALQKDGMNYVGREAMLAALDGYPLKDSAENGAIIGHRFIHPELGFQMQFPDEWVIQNTPQALAARIRQKQVYFYMGLKELRKRESAETILKRLFPERHMGEIRSGVKGKYLYARSMVMASAPHVSKAAIDVTVFLDGPRAFIVLLYSLRDEINTYQTQFNRIWSSFRSYDITKDGDVPKIHNYIWKRGDSWKILAERGNHILGRFTADRLAALNGMDVNKTPSPGTVIKNVQ
ncbi:MAG: M48 family metalloprotease [Mariprofundaceae bacterium]|nr:M48 family metalloprotease [Mariprofundaceae bacterium]